VRMRFNGRAVVVAMILGSVAVAGCSKKDNYAADTTAVSTPVADTTTTTTASSTTTMTPDTTAKTMAVAPATKKTSTKKKAPTKPTY